MMARFTRAQREQIIKDYVRESGANRYDPDGFIEWLKDHPENPAYEWFDRRHAWDTERAAHEHRLLLARQFTHGLKVDFHVETIGRNGAVSVKSYTIPAMISPISGRRDGGGYTFSSADEPEDMDEICRQGARALESWCDKYEGAVAHRGGNINAARKLIALLAPKEQDEAA